MADSQPYGDVAYADPGYQKDGQKRYPIDTAEHVKAAWSYINQADNAAKYSAAHLAEIKDRIEAAAKKFGIKIAPDDAEDKGRSAFGNGDSIRIAASLESNGRTLSGLAVPYGVLTEIKDQRGHYQEQIAPGAFTEAIKTSRPRMLFEHGQDSRTGRTPIGSFSEVWEEADGLHVRGQLFDNELVRPLTDAARAGELAEWSIHFRTSSDGSDESWTRTKGWDIRTVNRAKLPEVSLVNFGAYPTTVSVRSSVAELTDRSDAAGTDGGTPDGEPEKAPEVSPATDTRALQRARTLRLMGIKGITSGN